MLGMTLEEQRLEARVRDAFEAWLRQGKLDPCGFRGHAWLEVWRAAWTQAAAEEREACAKAADSQFGSGYSQQAGFAIGRKIRARGQ